jgi:hypothetical protein
MTGDILKLVLASGASKATAFARVYATALLAVSVPGSWLLMAGGPHGKAFHASPLFDQIGTLLVVTGMVGVVVALPLLLAMAVLFVVFGGLK